MNIEEIKAWLGSDWSGYRNIMVSILFNNDPLITAVNDHIAATGGKQLRPMLALLSGGACGGRNKMVLTCAAVAEMIHTATLLHDDVTDNGDLRRGKPTVKALFTPAISILSGDYWLARALYLLCNECTPQILECFTTAVEELAEGEMIQLTLAQSLGMTEEIYYEIISKKTSSLFIAATRGAAISAGGSSEEVEAITHYSLYLGQAFQIRDDIFDYSPSLNTGKGCGADIKERKITSPLIYALREAPKREAKALMEKIEKQSGDVAEAALCFVKQYNGVALAQAELVKRAEMAKEALNPLTSSVEKSHLTAIADYLSIRNL